jgi:hypothetical protein
MTLTPPTLVLAATVAILAAAGPHVATAADPVQAQGKAQAAADTGAAADVLAFEKARWEATVAGDGTRLAPMLADDLTYIHASGYVQTKKEYLDGIASKQLVYHTYDLKNPRAQLFSDVAITHGLFSFSVTSKGEELKGQAFYTGVYHRTKGKWQLVSWQTTRVVP